MELAPIRIDPDIRRASTLPARVYSDPAFHEVQKERVFARSWQLALDATELRAPGHVYPFTLLRGCLDEPLVLTRAYDGRAHCLSNVCTHRGAIVVEGEGYARSLRCRYHGRKFGLDGCFASMPEFEEAENFPSPADDLPRVALEAWERFLFCSLDPAFPLDALLAPMRERVGFLPLDEMVLDPAGTHEYLVRANWALYCDNYLEGLHVPYVHPVTLGETLDYGAYRTETFDLCSLQVGVARPGEEAFDLPVGHPDAGTRVAAYWFFLFPNLMFNWYPWGLSINVVQPAGVDRTRVGYRAYVLDPERRSSGAGSRLDVVEWEDEEVVESVQQGVHSRLYDRGRYSPTGEVGVHHFHRLLTAAMNGEPLPPATAPGAVEPG